ncbi:MAG: bifunctional 2-C-methyl-D-erythritol 4-phosphate cytidylyltransferase/2-C-methyl-D-erythritol 2,4-cyclodiphosphate synthase [Hyphomicrobium sp.]|nr:bifunctional 2-C-methyl-D-erythritol 4-phosphate cytidylyltransferase/2-C-methyl-D-erythritol 2,4-cyclodiphosphate synthase [Hyphomicrobium sp.]
MSTAALIVAAGRGSRASSPGSPPKQYSLLNGVSILRRTVLAFLNHPRISSVTVVIHADDDDLYMAAMKGLPAKLTMPLAGGTTRQDSVRLGLEGLVAQGHDAVLIHDAARPFVSEEVISGIIDALARAPGAIAALPVTDTLKEEAPGLLVARTISRDRLWRAQTPQGFRFNAILDAHRAAHTQKAGGMTDDAAIAEWAGLRVAIAPGSETNIKLTTIEDLAMAERRLQAETAYETRTATGFDVHRFTEGDHVWLGGVKIPHTQRLDGHSDADVVLHALTDALLGTIGDGDIGQHFPPSDPQWKGASSILFLKDAARRVTERGGRIVNVDMTILAEAPKIGPHRAAMQAVIGAALGLSADRIGIKATTNEGLGYIGRREGIAAMASATVTLPSTATD